MKVIASDKFMETTTISVTFYDKQKLDFKIQTIPFEQLLKDSDFISVHVPAQKD